MFTEDEGIDMVMKIVVCGDSAVGKTNLLKKYLIDEYDINTKATIGVDFLSKDLYIEGQKIKIQFFDTAGQEKYRSICSTYYKNSDGVILVYDITSRITFESIESWLEELYRHQGKDSKVMLVGNKIDLVNNREVTTEEGESFANAKELFFMETSALTNKDNCVGKAFDILINEIKTQIEKQNKEAEQAEYDVIKKRSIQFGLKEKRFEKLSKTNDSSCKC